MCGGKFGLTQNGDLKIPPVSNLKKTKSSQNYNLNSKVKLEKTPVNKKDKKTLFCLIMESK